MELIKFTIDLKCPKCAATGVANVFRQGSIGSMSVAWSGAFSAKTIGPKVMEIVCSVCDTTLYAPV